MTTAIEFENISKQYRLGLVSTGTLSHDLNRFWQTKVLRREDPYLKVGEVNDRAHKGASDYVWALKDINFKVEQGDVVGIIGRNGAGKSTLLKLLSRVTAPTTGTIRARGRIASLLEVGTGFHPEMTGRENIYMNGAIMGMSRAEITRKLDEIVDFSGCERYLDTPVKRYSSGMTVRLGFAIAAHLEPEILVVDEVLAVGDAEFQKKAIGKMQDVSRGEGRTVLFVSHNMTAVKSLCKNSVLLENGMIREYGETNSVVNHYLCGNNDIENHKVFSKQQIAKNGFELLEIGVNRTNEDYTTAIQMDHSYEIQIKYKLIEEKKLHLTLVFKNEKGEWMFSSAATRYIDDHHQEGTYIQTCFIPANFFNYGHYAIDLFVIEDGSKTILREDNIVSYSILNKERPIGSWMGKEPGDITPNFIYKEVRI